MDWFKKLKAWQKTLVHFLLFFLAFLLLFILFDQIWPTEEGIRWQGYFAKAFISSFVFELLFNWILIVPNYFKKKKMNERSPRS